MRPQNVGRPNYEHHTTCRIGLCGDPLRLCNSCKVLSSLGNDLNNFTGICSTMADTLHNAPIVLDNGSGTIRAGFAGEDLPKCYFPSFVGRPKHLRVLAVALEGVVFIGQRAQELRGLLKIRYPLEHGIVTDWDDMERIWQYVYSEELKTLSEEVCTPCVPSMRQA